MSNTALTHSRKRSLASFEILVRNVRQTFVLGQQRIEQERVRTYWKTGWYIRQHIFLNKGRAELGGRTIEKLGGQLGVDPSVLGRLKLFAEKYPVLATWPKLTWSHFRLLIPIEDDRTRLELTDRVNRGAWTTDKLEAVIKKELRDETKSLTDGRSPRTLKSKLELLKPKLGTPYTYQILQPESVHPEDNELLIDLGFEVTRGAVMEHPRTKLKVGDIIESVLREVRKTVFARPKYDLVKSERTPADLFTYHAWVLRVVDGDTLRVQVDLGFGDRIRQYLRLRGIDTPEINSAEGKKAKAFVEKCLKPAPYILLQSSRSDKYDRYLADVFIPLNSKSTFRPSAPEAAISYEDQKFLYLNNELLLRGLAVRMKS